MRGLVVGKTRNVTDRAPFSRSTGISRSCSICWSSVRRGAPGIRARRVRHRGMLGVSRGAVGSSKIWNEG